MWLKTLFPGVRKTDKAETIDDRTRVGGVSLITCTVKAFNHEGKQLYSKRFPLPKKTRQALGLIKGWMAFWEEQYFENDPNGKLNYEVSFHNVPQEVLEFSTEKFGGFQSVKSMLSGKLPPLGLRLIVRHLKRNYPNCAVYVNGERV